MKLFGPSLQVKLSNLGHILNFKTMQKATKLLVLPIRVKVWMSSGPDGSTR